MNLRLLIVGCLATVVFDGSCAFGAERARPSEWRISEANGVWQLRHNGEPFYIQGAVGHVHLDLLGRCGANAVRLPATKANLDAAHRAGLKVMANLPVRGERNNIDWNNKAQVKEQKQNALDVVRQLKDHPALMFWAVGNELDHIPGGKQYHPQLWQRLNDIAVAIKQIDRNHPTLTVVGTGNYEQKVQDITRGCPNMDLLGINTYGDLTAVTEQTRKYWPKPYVIAEWGPTGHWQMPKTEWRAPLEQTSSQKAQVIDERYKNTILADKSHCLGSFVFYWGEKQETTHTWYGLFCGGLRTESIDVLERIWSGKEPENRAPILESLKIPGFDNPRAIDLKPAAKYSAEIKSHDPDSDPLQYSWDIRPEVEIPPGSYAGSMEKRAKPIEGLIVDGAGSRTEFAAPASPGAYRLFVAVVDGKGHIAYANIPFRVKAD
ncbi:MAG: glycoside hydrolase family 2 TIM barrel-domain containing protein [Planctomycetota bacterium]